MWVWFFVVVVWFFFGVLDFCFVFVYILKDLSYSIIPG